MTGKQKRTREPSPTQDALLELAGDERQHRLRDVADSKAWAAAAEDPHFVAEVEDLAAQFFVADRETWPA
jgi:hypothetical protein